MFIALMIDKWIYLDFFNLFNWNSSDIRKF